MPMQLTTGDFIALAAVALNAIAYLSGIMKLNATVLSLKELMPKFERTMETFGTRLNEAERAVSVLENNCLVYHGKENV